MQTVIAKNRDTIEETKTIPQPNLIAMKKVKSNNMEKSFDTTSSTRANASRARHERSRPARSKSTGTAFADKRLDLLIRGATGSPTGGLRTLMVPLDGSAFAERALPLAVDIARRAGAKLQIVH